MSRRLPQQYARILNELTKDLQGEKLSEALDAFVRLLQKEQALSLGDSILQSFEVLSKKEAGVAAVTLRSAYPLSPEVKEKIQKTIGEKMEYTTMEDADLIGGIIIHRENVILDGSIRTQLRRLQEILCY